MNETSPHTLRLPLRNRGELRAHALIDAEDSGLTTFTWRLRDDGYVCRTDRSSGKARCVYLHRQIVGLEYGDRRQADHINRDRLDNRRSNLRIVTGAQNSQNLSSTGKSRFRGVYWCRTHRLWVANSTIEGTQRTLGYSHNEIEAARLAERARQEHMPFAQPDPALEVLSGRL